MPIATPKRRSDVPTFRPFVVNERARATAPCRVKVSPIIIFFYLMFRYVYTWQLDVSVFILCNTKFKVEKMPFLFVVMSNLYRASAQLAM